MTFILVASFLRTELLSVEILKLLDTGS